MQLIALIIVGIIVLILLFVLCIPIGVDVEFFSGELTVSAKVSGLLVQVFPKSPVESENKNTKKTKSKTKKEKKPKKTDDSQESEHKQKKKFRFNFNSDEIFSLLKLLKRALKKFALGLKVHRFVFHFTAGGSDPYKTAMTNSYINAALSFLYPIFNNKFNVADSSVWTDVDFNSEKHQIDAAAAFTVRLGAIIGSALRVLNTLLFGGIFIFIKNRIRLLFDKIREKKYIKSLNKNDNNLCSSEAA